MEEKIYIGCKIVKAIPMDHFDFYYKNGKTPEYSTEQNEPGYLVTYHNGYVLWATKEEFESAYREVNGSEKWMFSQAEKRGV